MMTIAAGVFKAKCLKLIDEVAATGEPVIVTKRGKPKVWMVQPQDAVQRITDADSIFGCLQHMVSSADELDDLVGPIIPADEWNHLKGDWSPVPKK